MKNAAKTVLWLALLGGSLHWLTSSDSSTSLPSEQLAVTDSEPVASAPPEFHGYPCTDDCSGHEAGYTWAEEHGITDEDDCGGNSESFIEGCKAYAEEQADDTDNMDQPARAEDGDSDND
jgi:hypothetical protein